ncbi:hypothetical protein KFE98_18915 [bacterium SCSIO 12741]|nr:hypothetical protein KFE98_18915 [bacterium SCSIO 12741]
MGILKQAVKIGRSPSRGLLLVFFLWISVSALASQDSTQTSSPIDEAKKDKTELAKDEKTGAGFIKKILKIFKSDKKKAEEAKGDLEKAKKYRSAHVHLKHMVKYSRSGLSEESHYDSLYPPSNVRYLGPVNDTLNSVVMGWHPYWQGSKYRNYNFQLLSAIAYFSYEVDPATGNYKSIHDWKETGMVDSAQAYGTEVYLTATLFGKSDNRRFLSNKKAMSTFLDSVISLLELRGAQGLMLDFENVAATDRQRYANFIIQAAGRLHGKGLKLGMTIAVYDPTNVLTINVLNEQVDMVVMMAYGFHGAKSDFAGPISTLKSSAMWGKYDIANAVQTYQKKQLDLSKLVIAFPYYGAEWQTDNLTIPSRAKVFKTNLTYATIQKTISAPPQFDTSSISAWIPYTSSNNDLMQVWYDDSLSLAGKYDWVLKNKVAGVGIWALGYDDGYTSLWALLNQKFTGPKDTTGSVTPDSSAAHSDPAKAGGDGSKQFVEFVFNHPPLLLTILSFFVIAALLAFVLAMTGCQTREILFSSRTFRLVFSAFFAVSLMAILQFLGIFSNNSIYSWLFFALGFLAANSLQMLHFLRPKEKP